VLLDPRRALSQRSAMGLSPRGEGCVNGCGGSAVYLQGVTSPFLARCAQSTTELVFT
jgi:hypothetical protein